jgi:hypothetical protein
LPPEIVTFEGALSAANVMLICPKCGERVRVRRYRDEDGHAARQCPDCKTVLGR